MHHILHSMRPKEFIPAWEDRENKGTISTAVMRCKLRSGSPLVRLDILESARPGIVSVERP
jgi:hypothetical protein